MTRAEGAQQMEEEVLHEAFEDMARYVLDRAPDEWRRLMVQLEFVADDVVRVSGEYADEAGVVRGLPFDPKVLSIADQIKQALSPSHRAQVRGLNLSLEPDGTLHAEFTYNEAG